MKPAEHLRPVEDAMPPEPVAPLTIYDRFPMLRDIEASRKMPSHVAIIMDGNRHWARQRFGEDAKPIVGHVRGMENIIDVLRDLRQIQTIRYVTLWAFSPENWDRPREEVESLMELFASVIPSVLPEIQTANGRFVHLGRKDRLPDGLKNALETAERETEKNSGQVVCLGIDYGTEDQEIRAMQKLLDLHLSLGTVITPKLRKGLLDTHLSDGTNISSIDLVFRTSGQQRMSGLPNSDYSEFYSIAANLPDAKIEDFIGGLIEFSKRERNFGGRPNK